MILSTPLSKDTIEQKHVVSQTFIERLSEVLIARNPKLDRQDARWSAEIVLTALRGFLPALAVRKKSIRSRTIDSLKQMLVRYLESGSRRLNAKVPANRTGRRYPGN
jgi:hypothetical protein